MTKQTKKYIRKILFILVAVLFIFKGSSMLFFASREVLKPDVLNFKNWRVTLGTIISAEKKYRWDGILTGWGRDRRFIPVINYKYRVLGKEYASNKLSLIRFYPTYSATVTDMIRKHNPGDRIVVYYDPKNPKNAVLEKVFERNILIQFLWAGFLLFVAITLIKYRNKSFKNNKPSNLY